jgi:hypothetical protein
MIAQNRPKINVFRLGCQNWGLKRPNPRVRCLGVCDRLRLTMRAAHRPQRPHGDFIAVLRSFRPIESGSETPFTGWQLRSRGDSCHGYGAGPATVFPQASVLACCLWVGMPFGSRGGLSQGTAVAHQGGEGCSEYTPSLNRLSQIHRWRPRTMSSNFSRAAGDNPRSSISACRSASVPYPPR